MSRTDDHGLTLSTMSDEAAAAYRQGVRLMLSAWPGADEHLRSATELDPGFALAHAARARLAAMLDDSVSARSSIKLAASLAAGATDRERSHIDVLSYAVTGRSQNALKRALVHVEHWPRDVIVLSLPLGAFGLFAFSGMVDHDQARVDLVERHAPAFERDDWWFNTYRGWALVENGEVARGRTMLEGALRERRANANGMHALAHAMHEGGAGDDLAPLVTGWLGEYDRSGILYGHIAWHAALAALERDDAGEALRIYAQQVQPAVSQGMAINVVSDAASLLWRVQAYGHVVPAGLWDGIAGFAKHKYPKVGHAFLDPHLAMIGAAVGDREEVNSRIAALEALVAAGTLNAGAVVPAISRAMLAFAEGDNTEVMLQLEPIVHEVARIGGSGAQREIVEDTLLIATMRAGEVGKARDLLERRLHRRSSPRDSRWLAGLVA